jgi:hypothetical protein
MDLTKTTDMMAARNECHSRVIDIPGVFATSVGFRHIAGIMTNEMAICVHVMKKMPRGELARAARILTSIDGLHIDVVEGRPPRLAADKERPVRGGIEVSGYGIHYGTLGCMVKDDTQNYMLSNEHVFGGVGTNTYQPASLKVCDQIGWVTKAESIQGGKMDCAISNLKKYDDGGVATIKGIGTVAGHCQLFNYTDVSKSGAHTDVTTGRVTDVDYTVQFDGLSVKGQTRVMSSDTSRAFGEQGDSGAVVVTVGTGKDAGKCWVGGLLWGVASSPASKVNIYGFLTPIDKVLEKMGVELLTGSKLLKSAKAPGETPLGRIAALLGQSRRGQTYWQSFVRNQDTLQRLFAESPRLAVMLKEVPQDALMDAILKASVEPESPIPSQIGGVDTGEVLSSFSSALTHYVGDVELRSHIEDLSKHITHHVGRSWKEALSDGPA